MDQRDPPMAGGRGTDTQDVVVWFGGDAGAEDRNKSAWSRIVTRGSAL